MLRNLRQPRRVVITGLGCVTPLGVGREAFWSGLRRGESGIRRIEGFDVSDSPVRIAGQVRGFDWERELKAKDRRHVARTVPLALAAGREALEDAGLHPSDFSTGERHAFGVVLGTGGGGLAFT
jgi:3-oxoacyl-[acyl-carrier-protein] synthase II